MLESKSGLEPTGDCDPRQAMDKTEAIHAGVQIRTRADRRL